MRDDTLLRLDAGEITAVVGARGARLAALEVPGADGRPVGLVLPAPDREEELPFAGATVGRWANRIAGARFELDGAQVALVPNEATTSLHGGPDGFHLRTWEVLDGEADTATFRLVSADGDQGFPGQLTATVTYRLQADGLLEVDHRATTTAPTVVSLTNHAYWNLAGGGTVRDHVLTVAAARVLQVDDRLIPTAVTSVEGTRFDLRDGVPVDRIADAGGLDHCFLVDGAPVARLTHPPSGRWLEVTSDAPGLQVFTADGLADPWCGMCLEPQRLPDAPNRPDLGASVLRPGEVYRHRMGLRVGTS